MHTTVVVMKDGRKIDGYIWEKRTEEGYITLMATADEEYDGERLMMEDMVSCTTLNERISINQVGDYDELEGWRKFQSGQVKWWL